MLKICKLDNNGEVVIVTNICDADKFMSAIAEAIDKYADATEELGRDLEMLIPNAFEIMLKLKGYKTDKVMEQRLLYAGTFPAPNEGVRFQVEV